MSQRTATATRREIRRAFGHAAIRTLGEQDEAIKVLADAIVRHESAFDVLGRGFLGRLRWVLTGR